MMSTTTTTSILSVSVSTTIKTHRFSAPKQGCTSTNQLSLSKSSSTFTPRLYSSPSSTAEEENGEAETESATTLASSVRGCKGCGKEEKEQGCNGEGRIQGGIATVPGLGWWPIKAYRPCPAFVASGGRYKRIGQTLDEVAGSGRVDKVVILPIQTTDDVPPSSKKKRGSSKLKK